MVHASFHLEFDPAHLIAQLEIKKKIISITFKLFHDTSIPQIDNLEVLTFSETLSLL